MTATRLALVGVICIFGGEGLCILGPLRYEQLVHVTCHAILYGGIVLVTLAAILNWRQRATSSRS